MAEKHSAIAVAYSDGKDSRVVLDLAMKAGFKRVEAFHMYLVPDLECNERGIRWAQERYSIKVWQFPSFGAIAHFKDAMFCDPLRAAADLPKQKEHDAYLLALNDLDCTLVMTGARKSDSLRRRFLMKKGMALWQDVMFPIADWVEPDVLAYLAMNKIELPEQIGKDRMSGVSLTTLSMLHLHDHHPEDFEKVKAYFPYVEAYVKRREFYGA